MGKKYARIMMGIVYNVLSFIIAMIEIERPRSPLYASNKKKKKK